MVRLHTSLIALTFATGLVLASSDDYQRRDNELFERDFDAENFFHEYPHFKLHERSDTYDEPEARSFLGALFKIGEEVGKKAIKGRVGTVMKVAKTAEKLDHHRKSAGKIEKKLKPSRNIAQHWHMIRIPKQANKNNVANPRHHLLVRELKDEELSRRDLDAEEVFGREYDFLDERDTFDDLD